MTTVDQSNVTITFADLAALVEDNTKVFRLNKVEITGDAEDEYAFSKALRGHPTLEELHLSHVTFQQDDLSVDTIVEMVLVSCDQLKVLALDHVPSLHACSLTTIAYCPTLQTLLLRNNGWKSKEDASILAAAVASSDSVETVDLSGNDIEDKQCFDGCREKNAALSTVVF